MSGSAYGQYSCCCYTWSWLGRRHCFLCKACFVIYLVLEALWHFLEVWSVRCAVDWFTKKCKVLSLTCLAEAIGTGILGGIAAYPVARFLMGAAPAGLFRLCNTIPYFYCGWKYLCIYPDFNPSEKWSDVTAHYSIIFCLTQKRYIGDTTLYRYKKSKSLYDFVYHQIALM